MKVCETCGRVAYYDCAECGKPVCDSHVEKCSKCGRWFCHEHIKQVGGKFVCTKCLSSRIVTYFGVAAVMAFITVGMLLFLPRIQGGLEITEDGEVDIWWNTDANTVGMTVKLSYTNESGSALEIEKVVFNDEKLQGGPSEEIIQIMNTKIENEEGVLKISLPHIPYDNVETASTYTGTLYWRKEYREKEKSVSFSFTVDHLEYPVTLGKPIPSPREIMESKPFTIQINANILDTIPEESKPLNLEVEIVEENIARVSEPKKLITVGKEETYTFRFDACSEGEATVIFKVIAGDGTQWNEEKLQIDIKKCDQVRISKVELYDDLGRKLSCNFDGSYEIKLSKEDQEYRYLFKFSVEGTGDNVIILVYFDIPYNSFNGVNLKNLKDGNTCQWNNSFEGHRYGLLIIIPQLKVEKLFSLEFSNLKVHEFYIPEEALIGVALIKINEETGEFCKKIEEIKGREFSPSTYELNCERNSQRDYEYCKKEFRLKFEKERESSAQSETPRPSKKNPGKEPTEGFPLVYTSLLFFVLSYLSLRKGGIL